jgi:hypothetical protein
MPRALTPSSASPFTCAGTRFLPTSSRRVRQHATPSLSAWPTQSPIPLRLPYCHGPHPADPQRAAGGVKVAGISSFLRRTAAHTVPRPQAMSQHLSVVAKYCLSPRHLHRPSRYTYHYRPHSATSPPLLLFRIRTRGRVACGGSGGVAATTSRNDGALPYTIR